MMTTHRIPDYDYLRNNKNQHIYYAQTSPNNTGWVTNRSQNGPYNVIEKDFGDHKALYYIPSNYEKDYDLSQLDERPFYQEPKRYSPTPVVRRRYYHFDDDDDEDDDYEQYVEELPLIVPRRHRYISPERTQVIRKIYYEPSPPPPASSKIIEYIYEQDPIPKKEEILDYVFEEPSPRKRYVEEELPPIQKAVPPENLPRPSQTIKLPQLNALASPRRPNMKQRTPRISPNRESPRKFNLQNKTEQKSYPSLKQVLAENRARRGSRIPKPRREIHEDEFHDPPMYNKTFIKNDFFFHK